MFRWIGGILDRLFAVAGALVFSQIPLFMQHYTQRLAGHAAELKIQVGNMIESASFTGKTLEQLIAKFISSGDLDFVRQGELMQQALVRYHKLTLALQNLEESTPLTRPFVFLSNMDWKIFHGTLDSYTLGITFSFEGGVYAILGVLLGVFVYRLLVYAFHFVCNLVFSIKQVFSR